ncbi:AN1-type zinc finger domain-containing protein [Halobacterium hubeiense]|uniref:AN1-type zinc finger domain-containing protein n=1 Tax=Halobacterium hubeiense TaxID=1407499 RepID=UPI003C78BBE8
MADCDIAECEGDHLLSYTCNECEGTFCTEHRLPESHDCPALRISNFDDSEGRFETGLQDKPGKRGMTSRDEKTGSSTSTSTSSSSTETESKQSEASSDATDATDEIDLSRHGHGRPSPMDVDDSQTVGTAKEPTESPSPDVDADGSVATSSETTTEATEAGRPKALGRFRLWAVGVVTTASTKLSNRVRRLLSWLWWLLTGIARLAGAGATLAGIGWLLFTAVHVPPAGAIQLSPPNVRSVSITAIGLILVIVTARIEP